MTDILSKPSTAFEGHRLLLSGPLIEVALMVKNAAERGTLEPVLAFDDATGRVVDFDLRGTKADLIARLSDSAPVSPPGATPPPAFAPAAPPAPDEARPEPRPETRGRGRPKLGVVAREVTLLPRHWDWLAAQPGGASVTLRRLVEAARRDGGEKQKARAAQEAAYRFMSAMAGDFPGFEEAARALFGQDPTGFAQRIAGWPRDVRDYATRLAFGASPPSGSTDNRQ